MTSAQPGDLKRTDTPDPHRSRVRALKILFDADVRGESPADALERILQDTRALDLLDDVDPADLGGDGDEPERVAAARRRTEPVRLDPFTKRLVRGVSEHREDIDRRLADHAHRWRVERMPVVDRTILRLATYELSHEDTAPAIVMNEALELAKELSTDKSSGFINGVLEAIRRGD